MDALVYKYKPVVIKAMEFSCPLVFIDIFLWFGSI